MFKINDRSAFHPHNALVPQLLYVSGAADIPDSRIWPRTAALVGLRIAGTQHGRRGCMANNVRAACSCQASAGRPCMHAWYAEQAQLMATDPSRHGGQAAVQVIMYVRPRRRSNGRVNFDYTCISEQKCYNVHAHEGKSGFEHTCAIFASEKVCSQTEPHHLCRQTELGLACLDCDSTSTQCPACVERCFG